VPATVALSVARLCCDTNTGSSLIQCVLTGDWTNDLGSNMTIKHVDEQGKFDGSYLTAVKNCPGTIHISPLVGYQHRVETHNKNIVFGFTVNWSFSDSITVFTGQCFVDNTGKEFLKTMWLLRSHVDNDTENWKAT
ncbi:AVR4 protein, partial [Alopecoenas beccarii]|nr:AVR4 protein [Alopecoenas beccarii]